MARKFRAILETSLMDVHANLIVKFLQQENSENVETENSTKSRPRRKGKKVEDSASSTFDEEDNVLKSKPINMSRMGDMIRNSPVAQGSLLPTTEFISASTLHESTNLFDIKI